MAVYYGSVVCARMSNIRGPSGTYPAMWQLLLYWQWLELFQTALVYIYKLFDKAISIIGFYPPDIPACVCLYVVINAHTWLWHLKPLFPRAFACLQEAKVLSSAFHNLKALQMQTSPRPIKIGDAVNTLKGKRRRRNYVAQLSFPFSMWHRKVSVSETGLRCSCVAGIPPPPAQGRNKPKWPLQEDNVILHLQWFLKNDQPPPRRV